MALPKIPAKINLDVVMKLPLQKKAVILVAVNVAIVLLIGWFLIWPKVSELGDLKKQFSEISAKLEADRKIAANIPKYLKEKEEMEQRLELALKQLPNEKEIPDLIDSISTAAEKSGLKIILFKPGKEVPKGFYADVPINMTVSGRYESLYEFSSKIAALPRIVNMSSMDVKSEGHKNRLPALKAVFVATTFRFIPQPQEGAVKK